MAVVATVRAESAGGWVVLVGGAEIGAFRRQREARVAARRAVQRAGGGEVRVESRSGRVAEQETVPRHAGRSAITGRPVSRGSIGRMRSRT